MRRGKLRSLALLMVLLMFAAGLAIFLYPYLWGAMVDREISLNAQAFLNRDETAPTIPEVIVNTWTIVMGIFDAAQKAESSARATRMRKSMCSVM